MINDFLQTIDAVLIFMPFHTLLNIGFGTHMQSLHWKSQEQWIWQATQFWTVKIILVIDEAGDKSFINKSWHDQNELFLITNIFTFLLLKSQNHLYNILIIGFCPAQMSNATPLSHLLFLASSRFWCLHDFQNCHSTPSMQQNNYYILCLNILFQPGHLLTKPSVLFLPKWNHLKFLQEPRNWDQIQVLKYKSKTKIR